MFRFRLNPFVFCLGDGFFEDALDGAEVFLGGFGWMVVELNLCSVPDVEDGCEAVNAVGEPWFVGFVFSVEVL